MASSGKQVGGKDLASLVDGLHRGVSALSDDPNDSQNEETQHMVGRLRRGLLIVLRKCVQQREPPQPACL